MTKIQLVRGRSIALFHSSMFFAVRSMSYFAGLIGIFLIASNIFIELPLVIFSLAILFLTPGVLFAGYSWYVSYLEANPAYGLTPKDLELPENRLDFSSLAAVEHMKEDGWVGFWESITRNNSALELLLRLHLTTDELDQRFSALVTDEKFVTDLIHQAGESIPAGKVGSTFDLLRVVLKRSELTEFFTEEKVSPEEIDQLVEFYRDRHQRLVERKMFWLHPEKTRTGGFAADWALSYTNVLDQFTTEINNSIKFHTELTPLLSRQIIVDQVVVELQKQSNHNLLLVGEEGIGRKEIFYHVADALLHYQTKTELDGIIVRVLDVPRLVSATDSVEQLQQLIDQIFSEITRSGRILLFIDPLELLISPTEKIGSIDLSLLFASYLQDERVHVIATATPSTYVTEIKSNQSLQSLWTKIEIDPPTVGDLPLIVLSQIGRIEAHYRCFFIYEAVRAITQLSGKYLTDQPSPQREILIAEEVAARSHGENNHLINEEAVIEVIERKSGVPIALKQEEQTKLQNLPELLHQRVIGQDYAISEISDALIRARAGLGDGNKPIGTFLFLGPTGVGKTETAKALANVYFGSEQKLIRLNMTEYSSTDSLTKLLGTNESTDPGALTIAIQESPSAVLLLDEFEKAHQQVQNVFFQVLDEGRLSTNYGKVLTFTNTIIIATSNAGSDFIKNQIDSGRGTSEFSKQLLDYLIAEKVFSPELLNRFNSVAVFSPLNINEIEQITAMRVGEVIEELHRTKNITIELGPNVIKDLAARGYDPVFGARALDRVIKSVLVTTIAKKIIIETPKPGSKLIISDLK